MANTIVECGRCFHVVVCDLVYESGSDMLLMRSTIVDGGREPVCAQQGRRCCRAAQRVQEANV